MGGWEETDLGLAGFHRFVEDGRTNGTRLDAGHRHVIFIEFHTKTVSQSFKGVLARTVNGSPRDRDKPSHRADLNEPSCVGTEGGKKGVCETDDAPYVLCGFEWVGV